MITQNGGQISPIVECFTHQISLIGLPTTSGPDGIYTKESFAKSLPNPKNYYPGRIISIDWLKHSLAQGNLLASENYTLMKIDYHPTPH
jgi:hypothetical protein